MNTDRKAKLEKALAFNRWFFNENTILYNNDAINDAERHHKNCLSPLHEALVATMENLEDIKAWCKDRDAQPEIVNMKCLSLSSEALSKIDKVLEDMK